MNTAPSRNIELKARLRSRKAALSTCRTLGASSQGDIHQVDTYFIAASGRLKLREAEPGHDELVFYHRPDVAGPKRCDYSLEPVRRSIKPLLAESLGVLAVVEKTRTLFLWENVRIHLDHVTKLGDFIEFEAVMPEEAPDGEGYAKLDRLIAAFELATQDFCATSYLEMMLAAG